MDGEDRERKMIEDQIARARAAAGANDVEVKGLERKEGEKISLSLFPKAEEKKEEVKEVEEGKEAASSADASATSTPSAAPEEKKPAMSFGSFGKAPVAIANPLKRPAAGNVFKAAKAAKTDAESKPKESKAFVSEAERLMKEDQARKAARGYSGAGPRRGDARR